MISAIFMFFLVFKGIFYPAVSPKQQLNKNSQGMDRRKSVLFLRHGLFSPRGFFHWQGAAVWEKRKSAAKLIMDSEG